MAGSVPGWARLPLRELLDVPIRDLGLRIEGSALEPRLAQLGRELAAAGLRFRPYAWLSTGWFTPSGFTGFAIPFYLAHPRLVRLERRQMLEVEGGGRDGCMRLLRHETAHALDHAYRLRRRKDWRLTFGPAGRPYRSTYVPRPGSRSHVRNLESWYAQSHPVEDFAETFAVWLAPRSAWRRRYAGWPALAKLEYLDGLMAGMGRRSPPVRTRGRMEPVSSLEMSLGEYYRRKRARYRRAERPAQAYFR